MTPTERPQKCVNCGRRDKNANGVIDMYGRFWCEDCLIFVLGDLKPGVGM
jgi:hypothetical protein